MEKCGKILTGFYGIFLHFFSQNKINTKFFKKD
jgi:hypothetical protein